LRPYTKIWLETCGVPEEKTYLYNNTVRLYVIIA
jgi:hypothetical protein